MAKWTKWIDAPGDEYTTDVAVRCLQSRFAPLQHYLDLAARKPEEDVEYVHQLRVWSRRAGAATHVFEEFLPPRRTAWLNKQLRRLRQASNEARDDDVFCLRLAADAADPDAARVLAHVREHRREAQQPLVARHRRLTENRRLEKRLAKLLKRVRWRNTEQQAATPRFGTWAAHRLRLIVELFFAAAQADLAAPGALHRFRIAGKKLRYALELLAGALPDALRAEVYPCTSSLQEKLGEINDYATAQVRLQRWVEASSQRDEIAYLQRLLADAQQRWEQSRTAFFAWWTADRQQQLRDRFQRLLG